MIFDIELLNLCEIAFDGSEAIQLADLLAGRVADDKVEQVAVHLGASYLETGLGGAGHIFNGEVRILDKRDEKVWSLFLQHVQFVAGRSSDPIQVLFGDGGLDAGDQPVLAAYLSEILEEDATLDVVGPEKSHYSGLASVERLLLHIDDGHV